MSKLSDDIKQGMADLIRHISGLEDTSEKFMQLKKQYINVIRRSNNMYFSSHKEINDYMNDMSNKYILHGFFSQANELQAAYTKYLSGNLTKSECQNRLNNVKFVLEMSERPTKYFFENPEEFTPKDSSTVENINWGEYLNEGIERWEPDDESTISTETEPDDYNEATESQYHEIHQVPVIHESRDETLTMDFRLSREELLANVQHSWFKSSKVLHRPSSGYREANIGILWEEHLNNQVQGLVPIPRSCVISEYKVIREVLFQLWSLHNSTIFRLEGNGIKVKEDVTIASVRSIVFETFMQEFLPYIELLEELRDFLKSTDINVNCPCTYRSYAYSIKNIMKPIFKQLVDLEDLIRKQDTTYTLLRLAEDLMLIFKPLFLIKRIHTNVVMNFETNDSLTCATSLINSLHKSLQYSLNKLDQDLTITIFLETLYHYFHLINSWLIKDDFQDANDYSKEFVLENKNNRINLLEAIKLDWTLKFDVRESIPKECQANGIIKIICTEVLKIGRNIHLLRLLGRHDIIEYSTETIHQEFIRKSLEGMCKFFDKNLDDFLEQGDNELVTSDVTFKFPVIPCEGDVKKVTEMDRLENLVDITDGFLMRAFENFFVEKPADCYNPESHTLYDKISRITTNNLLPVNNFFENIFHNILKERFTISGLMVKNVLIEKYKLYQEFSFLRHLYLFHDDLISPFYRKLFKKMYFNKNWGNEVWLTSHLQDVLADAYPDFYEKSNVMVDENWMHSRNYLDYCRMIKLHYQVDWPTCIIITKEQINKYQAVFEVLLKIKWGLHTLNHLAFTDFEPKRSKPKKPLSHKVTKLKYLKFCMLNLMNSIQHFIFGFIITKSLLTFELEFEKSNDLNSIISSHNNFINSVHDMIMEIYISQDQKYGFNALLMAIRVLDIMWNNIQNTNLDKLKECNRIYEKSYEILYPLINPTYIFDY